MGRTKRYGFFWVTLVLFGLSLVGHWGFGWGAYANEARDRGEQPKLKSYAVEMGRDTLENWQSEFLQLIWQVAGLAYLLYVGSPQSKEQDERMEAKMDFLLRRVPGGEEFGREVDRRLARRPVADG